MKKRLFWSGLICIFLLLIIGYFYGIFSRSTAEDQILIYGREGDAIQLDPIQTTDQESLKVTSNVMETLVQMDPKNKKFLPGLATRWETSVNPKHWIFHLRKGVLFHDGTPFNADAVVYNFNRWSNPDHPEHKGDFTYYAYIFGGLNGDPHHKIKQVSKIDDYTVRFELNQPKKSLLSDLAMPQFSMASPTALKRSMKAFQKHPIGTGPFVFGSWKPNDSIHLVKNPKYWGKGFPKLKQVTFQTIPDPIERLESLRSGEIDLMDGIRPEQLTEASTYEEIKTEHQQALNVTYLVLNVNHQPLDHPKIREAFNHVIDKQQISKRFYPTISQPAIHLVPPFLFGYHPDIKEYPYDIERAKFLLNEGRYPGPQIQLMVPVELASSLPNGLKIAEYIRNEGKKAGLNIKIDQVDRMQYQRRLQNGEYQIALVRWDGFSDQADHFLSLVQGPIKFFYQNHLLDKQLNQAQKTEDRKTRWDLYKQAQEIIKLDVPVIPLVHTKTPYFRRSDLKGFSPHPTGLHSLKDVYTTE